MSKAITIPIIDPIGNTAKSHIITTDTDAILRIEVKDKGKWVGGKMVATNEKEYSVTFTDGRSYPISKAVYCIIKRTKYGV